MSISKFTVAPFLDAVTDKIHEIIDGMTNKVSGATSGHLATLKSDGDIADSGTALSDVALKNESLQLTGGTVSGDITLGGSEIFHTSYIKKTLGAVGAGTAYSSLDSAYKDGTYHRMWRLRFPASCNFWGKIKVILYGAYSSFNASGVMSKTITCNFNGGTIHNNVGFYDSLGLCVENDFRISEAIWNSAESSWEILIWQVNLSGNNPIYVDIEAWFNSNSGYLDAIKGITAQAVELTQDTTYTAPKATGTGDTKTVLWGTKPVYESPLGYELYDSHNFDPSSKQNQITANGMLIGDGSGNIGVATQGLDYCKTFYGICTGTASAQTATIDGITSYYDGMMVALRFNVATQRSATININDIGDAYLRARGDAVSATSTSTTYLPASRDVLFVYYAAENVFRAVWSYEGADTTDMHRPSYMRRTVGVNPLYSYKIFGVDVDGRIQPLTLETGTGTTKTVNTAPLNPDLFYYYGSTTTVATGGAPSASYVYDAAASQYGHYTFNGSLSTYKSIYLCGTINANGLFVLDNSTATSWYTLVPSNTAGISLSSYFSTGKVYIYLGSTYSSTNYCYLSPTHPRYMFDGTNLLPHEMGYVKSYVDSLNGNGVGY